MGDEVRKEFNDQLEELRQGIVRFGAMVTERIPQGTEVLLSGDLGAADKVIWADDELDALSVQLDEECARLLALQSPVATDLRMVLASIHLIGEIERSGDLVTNVAKGARRLYGSPIPPKLRGLITKLSEEAQLVFGRAIDAYGEGDAALAAAIEDMDDTVDALHLEYIQEIFESHREHHVDLQPAVQLAVIGRYYERIADHAVNVGERVVYMVTGWLPEHAGAARVEAADRSSPGSQAPPGNGASG